MLSHAEILRGAATVAADAAAVLTRMRGAPWDVRRKELRDVVTDADLAAEAVVLEGLRRLTPGAAILSEEAGASDGGSGERWIVDPLDGTVNYASGLPWFSVTLGYQRGGVTRVGIVHAPALGLVATYAEGEGARLNGEPAAVSRTRSLSDAVISVVLTSHFSPAEVARTVTVIRRLGEVVRGVRIIVSGGLEMCWVAGGQTDAFISLKADAVSHAGAMPMVRAAGGRVTRLDDADARDDDTERVASNGLIHGELLELVAGA
ncbi:inositol monophosphatase family protein [Falsiroseomonas sp. HW251]|uniref:inositol monophosphatase family protein n=1 Tax=Falsiroseomonas sp. HW251 TaxID=3390998 RepID=UPI003D316378